MNPKLAKNHAHYQAHIDVLSEECSVWECLNNGKEIECHIDVDKVLSQPNFVSRKNNSHNSHIKHNYIPKQNITHNNSHSSYGYHSGDSKRDKLIMKLNNGQKKKENVLGSILYSIFV